MMLIQCVHVMVEIYNWALSGQELGTGTNLDDMYSIAALSNRSGDGNI